MESESVINKENGLQAHNIEKAEAFKVKLLIISV